MDHPSGKPHENGQPYGPMHATADRLVKTDRFLHRFDRRPACLRVIRVYETASGTRYTRVTDEAWKGL